MDTKHSSAEDIYQCGLGDGLEREEPWWKAMATFLFAIPMVFGAAIMAMIAGIVMGWVRWHREVLSRIRSGSLTDGFVIYAIGCLVWDLAIAMFIYSVLVGQTKLAW